MVSIQKILFPVDFSERSMGAGRYVQAMAEHFSSELILLHAVEPSTYDNSVLDKVAVRKVELQMFLAAEFRACTVKRLVVEGDPTRRIVECARTEKIDLIMMPTHGWGMYRRFILGSVTAKVLHDAACPVWTCGHAEQAPKREQMKLKKILCAIDLRRDGKSTLRFAHNLARSFGAKLLVTHVCQLVELGMASFGAEDLTLFLVNQAQSELARICQETEVDADLLVGAGEVASVLQQQARDSHADLIVIGRSTDDAVLGRLHSNAYSIIRQAPCPVISV